MQQGVCTGHTQGFCIALKGMTRTCVNVHCINRCKCDSISFLDREKSHKDVGNSLVVTVVQCPSSEMGPKKLKNLSKGE